MTESANDPRTLHRVFRDLRDRSPIDAGHSDDTERFAGFGTFGWETLMRSKRILLVSEAGMGKSYECLAQQKLLWQRGEAAFFVDLADLATNDLRTLLANEYDRFESWAEEGDRLRPSSSTPLTN